MVERRQADEGSATSPNVYNALVQSISTVTPILEAFNHRHSNQHAAAHWWATFNTLRRRTRKLYITARTASRLQGRKLLRYHTRVLGESNHLLHHTIPQAYITSTQLAADNQHAPLGLLLLTCIAQINAAVQETMAETSRPAPLTIPKDNNSEGGSITASENNTSTVEKGLTVPRGDVASSSKLGKKPSFADKKKHASASKTADTGKQRDRTNDKDKSRKQKKKKAKKGGHDEFSSLFGSLK